MSSGWNTPCNRAQIVEKIRLILVLAFLTSANHVPDRCWGLSSNSMTILGLKAYSPFTDLAGKRNGYRLGGAS
jgi:hypothetical protein